MSGVASSRPQPGNISNLRHLEELGGGGDLDLAAMEELSQVASCLYGCFSKPQDVGVEVIASCPGHARGGCGRKA